MESFDRTEEVRTAATDAFLQLRHAILTLLEQFPNGLKNAEIAEMLGIASRRGAPQRNRHVWLILEQLTHEKLVRKHPDRRHHYVLAAPK